MKTLLLLLVLMSVLVAATAAQAAERPLVYVVVLDGLDGDKVDAGDAPFITSLLAGQTAGQDTSATYFRESRSVMVAETNPNHSAMMTGAYGGRSGIISNVFALYGPTENSDSCKLTGPEDFTKLPTEVSGENANCLVGETTFAAIKRQGDPDALLTAGIFGKPKLGRIFAGRTVDPARRDIDHLWAPCSSGADDDDYCSPVPTNPATGYANDDAVVMNEVLRTVRSGVADPGRPGPARRPDLTFVNLHQIDSAGHATGTGAAYSAAIGMADDQIRRLVDELKTQGVWNRSVLVLLSDHSMADQLTKTQLGEAYEGAGVPSSEFLALGQSGVELVYLRDRVSEGRFEVLRKLRAAALADGGVQEALYREPNPVDGAMANTIEGQHPTWGLTGPRVPDLFLTHKPGGGFSDPSPSSNPIPGHHGSWNTRDNFLAVVGGGRFVRQANLTGAQGALLDDTAQNVSQAENVDVASTVMGLFGLFEPRDDQGRFLDDAFDLPKLPGAGAPEAPALRARPRGAGRARIEFGIAGGVYDVQVRGVRGWRRVVRDTTRRTITYRVKRREQPVFRVRAKAASGVHGAYAYARARKFKRTKADLRANARDRRRR